MWKKFLFIFKSSHQKKRAYSLLVKYDTNQTLQFRANSISGHCLKKGLISASSSSNGITNFLPLKTFDNSPCILYFEATSVYTASRAVLVPPLCTPYYTYHKVNKTVFCTPNFWIIETYSFSVKIWWFLSFVS